MCWDSGYSYQQLLCLGLGRKDNLHLNLILAQYSSEISQVSVTKINAALTQHVHPKCVKIHLTFKSLLPKKILKTFENDPSRLNLESSFK